MKKLLILGLCAVAAAGQSVVLWDQATPLINRPLGGTGAILGAHLSQLENGGAGQPSNGNLLGVGAQGPANNVIADDFTLGTAATITRIDVFSYVTGSAVPTTTAVNWALGGAPVIGSGLTTTAAAGAFWSVGGQGVYRVSSTTTSDSTRRIVMTSVTGLNINLAAGTHFLSYSVNPGNFSPVMPWSTATFGRNMLQSLGNGAFAPVQDGLTPNFYGADMSFVIHGTPVPEPATMVALGLGAAAFIRRRRK